MDSRQRLGEHPAILRVDQLRHFSRQNGEPTGQFAVVVAELPAAPVIVDRGLPFSSRNSMRMPRGPARDISSAPHHTVPLMLQPRGLIVEAES